MQTKSQRVVASGELLSRKLLVGYIVMLGLAMSLIALTVDPYLPAFPEIGTFFGVANGVVQASFAGGYPRYCSRPANHWPVIRCLRKKATSSFNPRWLPSCNSGGFCFHEH